MLRSVLELWPLHDCQNFVSMAGVHMGQYGINGASHS